MADFPLTEMPISMAALCLSVNKFDSRLDVAFLSGNTILRFI